jgi:hypothetical protein
MGSHNSRIECQIICSIYKKKTPCEHNSSAGPRFYKVVDGKLVPSEWDGLFDANEISPQPPGGFSLKPLFDGLNKKAQKAD